MLDIKLIYDLMTDAEKIKDVDKKDFVKSQIIKIIGQDEYDKYNNLIDNTIEFIIFLSHNKKLLNKINKKCCCKCY